MVTGIPQMSVIIPNNDTIFAIKDPQNPKIEGKLTFILKKGKWEGKGEEQREGRS